jgi:hypothetical protein
MEKPFKGGYRQGVLKSKDCASDQVDLATRFFRWLTTFRKE